MAPVGPSTARPASSASSNQTAIAASAALCQVCRLENPSSNSPIRFAASSATALTRFLHRRVEHPGLAQQAGRGEVVGDPDRLEIGGEEQPAGSQHVVAVGIAPGSARRRPPRIRADASAASCRSASTPTAASSAARSASQRCCHRAQAPFVPRPGQLPAAARAAVRAGTPGSNSSGDPSSGQMPPSAVSCALSGRRRQRAAEQPARRARPGGRPARVRSADSATQLPARRRAARALSTGARPSAPTAPAEAACPAAAPLLWPSPGSSGARKNIEPPAPDPAALPPSTPASSIACSRPRHLRRGHAGIELLLQPPVLAQQGADPGEVGGAEGVGHVVRHPAEAVERTGDRWHRPARRRASPGRWYCPRSVRRRCSRAASAAPARPRTRGRARCGSTVASGSRKVSRRNPPKAATN